MWLLLCNQNRSANNGSSEGSVQYNRDSIYWPYIMKHRKKTSLDSADWFEDNLIVILLKR